MAGYIKARVKRRAFRAGGYSVFALALVILIALAVNLIAGALPETITRLDITPNNMFTLSEQTKSIVSALDKDVTIYMIAPVGNEDASILSLLGRYEALTPRVRVERVDPVAYPTFASKYTSQNVTTNSLIVVSGERARYIDYSEIYAQVESADYDTYYAYVYYYGYTEYYDYLYDWVFDGENSITSAIGYVTSDKLPKLYALSGHGEAVLPQSLITALERENILSESVNLINHDFVPEDADAVLIYAPASDISEREADMLGEYLSKGGGVILATDYIEPGDMPNLLCVAALMGMTSGEGLVLEGDADGYYRTPFYLLPALEPHEITHTLLEHGYMALYPVAQSISGDPETGVYAPLLSTTDSAYAKRAGLDITTYEREEGDTDGPFDVAACVEREGARMAWFTSAMFLTDEVNQMVSGANHNLFLNAVNWMLDKRDSLSIRYRPLALEALSVSAGDASRWSIILIGVIPLAIILPGALVIIRRKRR